MKLLLFGLLSGLVLGACGGGGDDDASPTTDALDAIQLAIVAVRVGWDLPEVIGEPYSCQVQTQFGPVAASCRWDSNPTGNGGFRVVFHETWSCEEFSADATDYPPCSGDTGFHEWVYQVDLAAGTAEEIDETGQFPPDYAR